MSLPATIFLRFEFPSPTTWFYVSLLLAVALFFKFSRLLSVRNWDVLTLFLLVPGFLLIREAEDLKKTLPALAAATELLPMPRQEPSASEGAADAPAPTPVDPERLLWFGYGWLMLGSIYFLIRCFLDLRLVRRPALAPNLNLSGMAWLMGTVMVCLVAVTFIRPPPRTQAVGAESLPIAEIKKASVVSVDRINAENGINPDDRLIWRWVERGLAIACHGSILTALILIGGLVFKDVAAGMGAAVFYLLLPYTAYHFEQIHHVWPMAWMLWSVLTYRRPLLAGTFLGLAAGSSYFPLLVAPVWISFYWGGRGVGRFLTAFALAGGLSLGLMGLQLYLAGQLGHTLQTTLALADWQPGRITHDGFWAGFHWAYRVPVFIAYLALLAFAILWPSPKNLAHLLAMSAAVLIGIQFWYADQGGAYVLWYLPLLLLLVFRPNLADRRPNPIDPETDRLSRFGRFLGRLIRLRPALPRVGVTK